MPAASSARGSRRPPTGTDAARALDSDDARFTAGSTARSSRRPQRSGPVRRSSRGSLSSSVESSRGTQSLYGQRSADRRAPVHRQRDAARRRARCLGRVPGLADLRQEQQEPRDPSSPGRAADLLTSRRETLYLALLLAGSAALSGLWISQLPLSATLLRPPSTPFDRGKAPIAPIFRLLSRAATVLPDHARVVIRSEPRDASAETSLHKYGVALLPGRRVLPAALWSTPTPDLDDQAEYVIVLGRKPSSAPGTLLFETADGSVWRRGPS